MEALKKTIRSLEPLRTSDPVAYIRALAEETDIRSHALRHRRAKELRAAIDRVNAARDELEAPDDLLFQGDEVIGAPSMRKRGRQVKELRVAITAFQTVREVVGFQDDIAFRGRRTYVDVDGVWIDCTDDAYYLRGIRKRRSIGRRVSRVLEMHGIEARTILDIGAYRGEAAFWLAKHHPSAAVHAVEASTETCAVLAASVAAQEFDTSNLTIHNHAIGAVDGVASFSVGKGTQNQLGEGGDGPSEQVEVKGMSAFLRDNAIDSVDFAKIDIEGAEPLLAPAFEQQGELFRMLLIEFSIFGARDEYIRLAEVLMAAGLGCHDGHRNPLPNLAAVTAHLKEVLDDAGKNATDLWFIR
jgi:FkbM family methyltransferase